ncbi:hypothetical protein OROMI_025316 [Orobanche minor]
MGVIKRLSSILGPLTDIIAYNACASSHFNFSPVRLSLRSKRELGISRDRDSPSHMDFSGCYNARDNGMFKSTDPVPPERQPSDGMYGLRSSPDFLNSIIAKIDQTPVEAISKLLDNTSGATRIAIDVVVKRESECLLLIEDNGRGMDPNELRQCMSLSNPAKSSIADTIEPCKPTQSIGLLSNKFLKTRSKEHIVVPMNFVIILGS